MWAVFSSQRGLEVRRRMYSEGMRKWLQPPERMPLLTVVRNTGCDISSQLRFATLLLHFPSHSKSLACLLSLCSLFLPSHKQPGTLFFSFVKLNEAVAPAHRAGCGLSSCHNRVSCPTSALGAVAHCELFQRSTFTPTER